MIYPVIQWHLTNRCNFRCQHCYHEDYSYDELDFSKALIILEQYKDWLLFNSKKYNQTIKGKIKLTGGEPLVKEYIFSLIEEINKDKELFDIEILTNGSLIDYSVARRLKQLSVSKVQVSLDGNEETNNLIRGKDSFIKIVNGIKNLVDNDIHTVISFTAHKNNYKEFPQVVEIGKALGVNSIWTDRLIPINNDLQLMSKEESQDYFQIVSQERFKCLSESNKFEVRSYRALQFIESDEDIYKCKAGYFMAILPNGDFYPCRRLPILIGNVFQHSIVELFENSPIMQELRKGDSLNTECGKCNFHKQCNGGLRCLNYALYKNLHCKDIHCPI